MSGFNGVPTIVEKTESFIADEAKSINRIEHAKKNFLRNKYFKIEINPVFQLMRPKSVLEVETSSHMEHESKLDKLIASSETRSKTAQPTGTQDQITSSSQYKPSYVDVKKRGNR